MKRRKKRKFALGSAILAPCTRGFRLRIIDVNGKTKSHYGCFTSREGAEQVLTNVQSALRHAKRWKVVKV